VSACGENVEKSDFREISWIDLLPAGEAELYESTTLESLGVNGDFTSEFSEESDAQGDYYGLPSQTYSFGIVSVVPVEFEEGNLVTEFFLVPYFGACFHQPPPPPNQTIYVVSKKPIKFESIYDPVWVMGVINTEQTGNDIATAAYKMDINRLEAYTITE